MATITDPYITRQLNNWARSMAESILGLRMILAERLIPLMALAVQPGDEVIDDGVTGLLPFTRTHFVAFQTLMAQLVQGASDPALDAVLRKLAVRSLDVIVSSLSVDVPYDSNLSPEANALRQHIRPYAPMIRRQRARTRDGFRVLPKLYAALADADLIDDGRTHENVQQVTIGELKILFGFLAAATDESTVNSEIAATAVDAACTAPLEAH